MWGKIITWMSNKSWIPMWQSSINTYRNLSLLKAIVYAIFSVIFSLYLIQGDEELIKVFLSLITQTESVVVCRATPKQKAEMVKLIRVR